MSEPRCRSDQFCQEVNICGPGRCTRARDQARRVETEGLDAEHAEPGPAKPDAPKKENAGAPAGALPVAWAWFDSQGNHRLTLDEPADYELPAQLTPLYLAASPPPAPLSIKEILRIADSMPRHPWGIGSSHSDAIAFARAILAAAWQGQKGTA